MAAARIAFAVGGGYLLGRTKKLRLAITVGSYLAGRRRNGVGGGVVEQGLSVLRESPEFDRLRSQLTGAGRTAALSAATRSLARVTERIESRDGSDDDESSDAGGDEDERPRRRSESADGRSERRASSRQRSGQPRTSTARKSSPRSAAPRKSASKKADARKSAPRKAAARSSSTGRRRSDG